MPEPTAKAVESLTASALDAIGSCRTSNRIPHQLRTRIPVRREKINTLAYHTCFGKSLWPLRHIRGDPHAPSVLHGEPPWIGVTTYFWGVWLNCTSQPPVDFRSFSQPVADWDEHHVFGRRRCTQAVRFVFALRREFSLYFARHCQQSRTKVPRLRREHSPLRSRLRATTKRCEKRTKRN